MTDSGPPDKIMPLGENSSISSSVISKARISEKTPVGNLKVNGNKGNNKIEITVTNSNKRKAGKQVKKSESKREEKMKITVEQTREDPRTKSRKRAKGEKLKITIEQKKQGKEAK